MKLLHIDSSILGTQSATANSARRSSANGSARIRGQVRYLDWRASR
jgi:hypothetical protein